MLDEKDLQAIAALMDKKLEPIKEDLAEVKEDLAQLKEESEITRGALNHLLEWSDKVSSAVDFPLPKS